MLSWGFISLRGPSAKLNWFVPGPAITALARMADATAALEYLLLKVRDSPKPFGPKSAGRSSFEQGRLGIVFLLDGPHPG